MGSLGGHLLPGTIFLLFSQFWIITASFKYAVWKRDSKLVSTSKHGSLLECYAKFILCLTGLLIELITAFDYLEVKDGHTKDDAFMFGCDSSGQHIHHDHHQSSSNKTHAKEWRFAFNNTQHMAMYASFLLSSVVEILVHKGLGLPDRTEYLFNALAYGIESLLFAFHLHSRAPLDIQLHQLLVIAILGCLVFSSLEFTDPQSHLFLFGRCVFVQLQGTWFWHIGLVLYPPRGIHLLLEWNRCSHDHVMLTTMLFCLHLLAICSCVLAQIVLVAKCRQTKLSGQVRAKLLEMEMEEE